MSTKLISRVQAHGIYVTVRQGPTGRWLTSMHIKHMPTGRVKFLRPFAESCLSYKRQAIEWALELGLLWLRENECPPPSKRPVGAA